MDGGGANNQLLVYADGIITVASEIGGVYRADRAREMTERIYDTTARVVETSRAEDVPTHIAATRLAERRIESVRRLRPPFRSPLN